MNKLIENYVNGNLLYARQLSQRRSFQTVYAGLREYGYGPNAAYAVATFLKGKGTFQAACDAEHSDAKG